MFARFHSAADHEALVEGLIKARKLRKQIELFQLYRSMGIRTIEEARRFESDRKKREQETKAQKMRQITPYLFETGRKLSNSDLSSSLNPNNGSSSSSSSNPHSANSGAGSMRAARAQRGEKEGVDPAASGSLTSNAKDKGCYPADPLMRAGVDISSAPGADCLSRIELQLCSELPMLPLHYLTVKEAIIR